MVTIKAESNTTSGIIAKIISQGNSWNQTPELLGKAKTFEQINLLQAANAKAQEEVSNLKSKFDKHNMNVLSLRKPKLIENIINRGTREVLSELETITNPTVNNM